MLTIGAATAERMFSDGCASLELSLSVISPVPTKQQTWKKLLSRGSCQCGNCSHQSPNLRNKSTVNCLLHQRQARVQKRRATAKSFSHQMLSPSLHSCLIQRCSFQRRGSQSLQCQLYVCSRQIHKSSLLLSPYTGRDPQTAPMLYQLCKRRI